MGAVAAFEHEIMLERQRAGIAEAKAEGKFKGRAPTARAKTAEVHRLIAAGCKPAEIMKLTNISRASFYRIAKAA
jgi:DNA invertase Pin-like site-specific DNA recombinase